MSLLGAEEEVMDGTALAFTVELGEPGTGNLAVRQASILLGDAPVLSMLVYDMDANGQRTEEQAERNITLIFADRLRELLGREDDA